MASASLRRRVAQLEKTARAAVPLVVMVRSLAHHFDRIAGPDGSEWHRQPGERDEDFAQRAKAEALSRSGAPSFLVLAQCPSIEGFDRHALR